MKKLSVVLMLFLAIPTFAQRTGKITWATLFEIYDTPSGVLREAKINTRFFKRLASKPNVWQRDMAQVREGIGYEWTEEIHLNPAKPESYIFITTDPFEFDRLIKLLTDLSGKDEFGRVSDGQGFRLIESKTLASGRKMSVFTDGERVVEVLSNNNGGIEEWIFQITRKKSEDVTPPEITLLEPAESAEKSRSLERAKLEKYKVKIKVVDPSGVKSVLFDGGVINLLTDGTYQRDIVIPPGQNAKTVTITATDNNSNTATKQFTIRKTQDPGLLASPKTVEPAEPLGAEAITQIGNARYYALLISVQEYKYPILNLENPHGEADALAKILTTQYRFNLPDVFILKDPTIEQLGERLEELQRSIRKEDNLLIFFSGHGQWVENSGTGYWLLKGSDANNKLTWLSNSVIKEFIREIKSHHTLLVTDACFAGSIFRDVSEYLSEKKDYSMPSRTALTSGNMEKVPDKSVFMRYFLARLRDNKAKYLSATDLYMSFRNAVINNSNGGLQKPMYDPIQDTGHEGGDFIFPLK